MMPVEGYFDLEHRWIYHVSSLLILPAWINLMLLVGRFPKLGCYSLMFTTVLQNFLKVIYLFHNLCDNCCVPIKSYFNFSQVMISFIFLIIGFALSFSLVFPRSEFFRDPGLATLRTIVMMVGEFDYMSTFSEEENVRFFFLSTLTFCCFFLHFYFYVIQLRDYIRFVRLYVCILIEYSNVYAHIGNNLFFNFSSLT